MPGNYDDKFYTLSVKDMMLQSIQRAKSCGADSQAPLPGTPGVQLGVPNQEKRSWLEFVMKKPSENS